MKALNVISIQCDTRNYWVASRHSFFPLIEPNLAKWLVGAKFNPIEHPAIELYLESHLVSVERERLVEIRNGYRYGPNALGKGLHAGGCARDGIYFSQCQNGYFAED